MSVNAERLSLRHIRDVEDEVLKQFSCGRQQLDDFLYEDARQYDAHGLTSTVLVFLDASAPVAYFSLTADSVHLSGGERTDLGLPFDAPISFYPAVKLTKLAVAQGMHRQGMGQYLVDLICGVAAEAPFAVRLVTVDAVNQEDVLLFYRHVGFMESLSDAKQRQAQKTKETVLMFKDLYQ